MRPSRFTPVRVGVVTSLARSLCHKTVALFSAHKKACVTSRTHVEHASEFVTLSDLTDPQKLFLIIYRESFCSVYPAHSSSSCEPHKISHSIIQFPPNVSSPIYGLVQKSVGTRSNLLKHRVTSDFRSTLYTTARNGCANNRREYHDYCLVTACKIVFIIALCVFRVPR